MVVAQNFPRRAEGKHETSVMACSLWAMIQYCDLPTNNTNHYTMKFTLLHDFNIQGQYSVVTDAPICGKAFPTLIGFQIMRQILYWMCN
jgi:hypothetical protein